jgi:hypothetical protein
MEPEGSLPCSQEPFTGPYSKHSGKDFLTTAYFAVQANITKCHINFVINDCMVPVLARSPCCGCLRFPLFEFEPVDWFSRSLIRTLCYWRPPQRIYIFLISCLQSASIKIDTEMRRISGGGFVCQNKSCPSRRNAQDSKNTEKEIPWIPENKVETLIVKVL